MITTRGVPLSGMPRKPSLMQNRSHACAMPWIDVIWPNVQVRGAHFIIAQTPRIPSASIDPTIKNYHWGDMTRALFEAEDAGADNAVLLDGEGLVTEGPGFNVFMEKDSAVVSPDRGALEGITGQTVFDLCDELNIPLRIGPSTAEDLRDPGEIFTSATAGGVMSVSLIDGTVLSNNRPGPISAS